MRMSCARARLRQLRAAWGSAMTRHGLARRMLVWILGVSALAALVATSVQLFFDYRRDVSALEQGMHYIEQSQLPGLADAAWNFNVASMQVQLDGIGRSPWVAGAVLAYGPSQSASLSTGAAPLPQQRVFEYVLQRNGAVVGKITILPNLQTLYHRTLERVVTVLCTQIVKSLVTSFIILLLLSWMLTRHLTRLAEFASAYQPGAPVPPLQLDRAAGTPRDELTVLVERLNDAYQRIARAHEFEVEHNEILSREVAQRTRELEQVHQKLARLAVTDRLTGTLNRLGLETAFQEAVARAQADAQPLSVILSDLDEFKAVNDRHGHLVGDLVLQEFAALLAATLPKGDILARWGGEEFLMICPATGLQQATDLAERLRLRVAGHGFSTVGHKTSSFGVASLQEGESVTTLVKRADEALYRAKREGRNRVCAAHAGP